MRLLARACAFGGLSMIGACGLHPSNNDSGGAINLARSSGFLVVAQGTAGLSLVRAGTGEVIDRVAATGASDSYDDVAMDGSVVLAHDADDGLLSSFRLRGDGTLQIVTRDLEIDAGPYSGVSMGGGKAIVSGGTCGITLLTVGSEGKLSKDATLDAFRGQPEVTMVEGGAAALLSTHFSGSDAEFVDGQEFGVSTLDVASFRIADSAGLPGAGVTEGGGRPASWPVRAAFAGDLAFVAHGGGLSIFRMGDDLGLERLAHLELDVAAVDVAAQGSEAFVAGARPPQVIVVDVADPLAPRVSRTIEVPGDAATPTSIEVVDDDIFVAANAAGLVRVR